MKWSYKVICDIESVRTSTWDNLFFLLISNISHMTVFGSSQYG